MDLYSGFGEKITMAPGSGAEQMVLRAPWSTVIHRGWVSGARENTLPAFWLVRENGYDWAECDVRFSADGVPVLAHDATLTSEDGAAVLTVAESTAAQLQELVLETHGSYGQIRMATLAELLDMAKYIGLSVLLDLKGSGDMGKLAQVVLSSGWAGHVVYMPGTVAQAAAIAAVDRNASFDFVTYASSLPTDLSGYSALLTGGNTVGLDISATGAAENITREQLEAIRGAGLSVSWWNVRESNCAFAFDAGPLRITKANTADAVDLDGLYLAAKTFW